MSDSPTLWCGSTLVVFDGPRRLIWRAAAADQWSLAGLWPSARQAAQVTDHLDSGGAVLVLVEQEQTTVPMYAEEAARVPEALAAEVVVDGELAEIRVPALDWLPEPLRERGRQFLRDTACFISKQPDLLLPHLLVEEPGRAPCNLRFARLRTPRPFNNDRLRSATEHLFASAEEALAVLEAAS
ncbi:hypothetical protein GCM10022403_067630 [Streptomyces coacervatus]|uniref:Uncharacterized protein n=1 Tax=Streptomyces coacervatus TaxID=647381 RepID=A0ABP7IR46_9ACTN|nr:hypothetical protein [Streptomyces coacervatus]MDF2266812.1 hypothetical protein [Streptomyces coacervatus]